MSRLPHVLRRRRRRWQRLYLRVLGLPKGEYRIPGAGVTVTFAEGTFQEGEKYRFKVRGQGQRLAATVEIEEVSR